MPPSSLRERLVAWRAGSTGAKILVATATVSGLTFAVKLAASAKELVVASRFGAGDALDAFLVAMVFPSFAINIVGGAINVALIPTYVAVRKQEGDDAARALLSGAVLVGTLFFLAVGVALGLGGSALLPQIATAFPPAKLELTQRLFLCLLPILPLTALTALFGAALNARERFLPVAAAPLLTPIAIVGCLVLGRAEWGPYALVAGTLTGALLELAVVAALLARDGGLARPRWRSLDAPTRRVVRQFGILVGGVAIGASSAVVDQTMAASLGSGAVSALSFGAKVPAVVIGVSAGLWTAVLPYFSSAIASERWRELRTTLLSYVRLALVVTVPVAAALVFLSRPIVHLLFERGAFTASDTVAVGDIQAVYAAQIPFYAVGMLYQRLLVSLQRNRRILLGGVLNMLLNVSLNYLFMRRWGPAGIALSTTVVAAFSMAFLWLSFRAESARMG